MTRSDQFHQGRRNGIKWAIELVHQQAARMNDPRAQTILNTCAFHIGVAAKKDEDAKSEVRPK